MPMVSGSWPGNASEPECGRRWASASAVLGCGCPGEPACTAPHFSVARHSWSPLPWRPSPHWRRQAGPSSTSSSSPSKTTTGPNPRPTMPRPQQIYGNPAAPYINSLVTPGQSERQTGLLCQRLSQRAGDTGRKGSRTSIPPSRATSGPKPVPISAWTTTAIPSVGARQQEHEGDAQRLSDAGRDRLEVLSGRHQYRSDEQHRAAAQANGRSRCPAFSGRFFCTEPMPTTAPTSTTMRPSTIRRCSSPSPMAAMMRPPANPMARHYMPLQQLKSDLAHNRVAAYNWISPDQHNDMHTPAASTASTITASTMSTIRLHRRRRQFRLQDRAHDHGIEGLQGWRRDHPVVGRDRGPQPRRFPATRFRKSSSRPMPRATPIPTRSTTPIPPT